LASRPHLPPIPQPSSSQVDASNLMPLTIILFGTLIGVYGVTALGGFKLTKCIGGIFFAMYFAFVAYTLLEEFGKLPF
jgi:hypothetical protein